MKKMAIGILLGALSGTLVITANAKEHAEHKVDAHKAAEHHAAHWGYSGETGPAHWAKMSDKFTLCGAGQNQSPINIKSDYDVDLPAITFAYKGEATKVVNNGHTIQVDIADGSSMSVEGKTYQLKQFHFHTPSENTIDGKSFPLEAHFVHRNSDENKFAVIAVMFKEGDANPVLDKIWAKMPADARKTATLGTGLDYTQLMPKDKDYYRFNGSFTTPPCTEGVRWYVLKKPLSVSKQQVDKFFATMKHANNRPVQPKEARIIVD